MCVSICSLPLSLSVLLWMLTDAVVSIGLHSHTHTSLSLCLSATLPSPLSFKRCCDTANGIIRNTDFSLSSSYHFKGYTYTKTLRPKCYIINYRCNLQMFIISKIVCWKKREKHSCLLQAVYCNHVN
jgi:hypothetical protein